MEATVSIRTSVERFPEPREMIHHRNLMRMIGVVVKDFPRYMKLMRRRNDYLAIRNRNELLELSPDGSGYRCDWKWTSDLHAPKLFPFIGRQLYRRAFVNHPIYFSTAPAVVDQYPEVTFIIGHRGLERLPLLEITLASIAAQRGATIECIVVEQDSLPQLKGLLPSWVRYFHAPPPQPDLAYNRSMAFNQGAQLARGNLLILHDNDMPVPQDYAAANMARAREGYEVINLKRFIFYLDQQTSGNINIAKGIPPLPGIEAIVQNLQAGGSIAITREAYLDIGGMDESFIGWGGEDNEFWERAETRKLWPYGSMPILHLWHAPQTGKPSKSSTPTNDRYRELAQIDPKTRIESLRQQNAFRNASMAPELPQ